MIVLDIACVVVSIIGLIFLISGFQKNKQSHILYGATAFIAPIFYLIGWVFLMPMAPPIAIIILFSTKKKEGST